MQLAALPLALLVLALTVTPRYPQRSRLPGAPPPPDVCGQPDAAFFAGGAAPTAPVDLPTTPPPATPPRGGWFQVTVVATLPDAATASRVADELTTLLGESARHLEDAAHAEARARLLDEASPAPLTPAESAAFERAGVTTSAGIGWPGARADARGAVLALGPVVIVPGLKADFSRLQRNPLAALLAARGARVLVEGEPAGGEPPVVDLSCAAPSDDAAARLAEALQDYLDAPASFALRPPWHPAGVSAAEARARSSFARLSRALRAVSASVTAEFTRTFDPYVMPADPASILRDLARASRERALEALDDAASDGTHDPVVLEALRRSVASATDMVFEGHLHDPALTRQLAARMGALSLEVAAPAAQGASARLAPTPAELAYAAHGAARAAGPRVELGRLAFHRIGRGLPALLAWLRTSGCADAHLAVVAPGRARGLVLEDE